MDRGRENLTEGTFGWIFVVIVLIIVAAPFLIRKNTKPVATPSPTPLVTATPTSVTKKADFVKEGNLIKQGSNWVLIYEKPGSPALQKTLVFDSVSLCVKAGVSSKCDPGSFVVGERVRVEGIEEGNKVSVIKLSFN